MPAVLRPLLIYFGLLVLVRITGKRSLGEVTTFDFILLLIIAETVQSALLAHDMSMTGAAVALITLLLLDVALSALKHRWRWLDRLMEDEPVVLYADGKLMRERMDKERIDVGDILEAARRMHGLEHLDEIRSAVLERRGTISVIPLSR
jgi:uncharacterized membrane protein YcaP (DUF421 family)